PALERRVLIRWGDRVAFDAPEWDPRDPTPEAAGSQFGWDGRLAGMVAPPLAGDGVPRLVVAVAHPRVDPAIAFPIGRDRPAVAAAMQGASLLNLQRVSGEWLVVDGGFQSRRLDAATLCRWSGPGAGADVAQGILGPEGGCATPWRSLLLAEGDPAPWLARLRDLDPRFEDAARFGWVVELDPLDPQSVPVKRAALGRVGAAAVLAALSGDGRAVVLMADGRAMGFLYRFVSSRPAIEPDGLDAGALAVARVEGGAIRWLPLPAGSTLDPAGAAERAGGTRFDTPA
ncbi:alkaline phosphatase PhoX, partial [Falsiroseomonas oryziterrae]|uniref:alkaline phosphatase PhoX n=1 Tax=Falsiroseomonas oryziterrae TaxID=2911368 RepID=UPI001F356DC6